MTTVFKVGDVVRLKNDREAPGRRVVTRVAGLVVEYDAYHDDADVIKWNAHRDHLELVSRAAPPSFASCTDPSTPPACANEAPPVTVGDTVVLNSNGERYVVFGLYSRWLALHAEHNDNLVCMTRAWKVRRVAAKAEAIAEREGL
jgi:hypothetical protein